MSYQWNDVIGMAVPVKYKGQYRSERQEKIVRRPDFKTTLQQKSGHVDLFKRQEFLCQYACRQGVRKSQKRDRPPAFHRAAGDENDKI